jgi:hypothetical protein
MSSASFSTIGERRSSTARRGLDFIRSSTVRSTLTTRAVSLSMKVRPWSSRINPRVAGVTISRVALVMAATA